MIGGLKPYPAMKDSGVEWLGQVPEHWEVASLGRLMSQRKEKNDPIKTTNILSLSLKTGVVPYSEKPAGGNKSKEDLTAYMLAYPGDIVVNSMNVVVGSVGLSKYFGAVSPVYYMLRPRKLDDVVEYFNLIFQDRVFQKSLFGLGNGIMYIESKTSGKLNTIRLRIPMNKLKKVLLPHPAPNEQTAIVRFLDHIDRRIRRYIRAKQKLIKLLEEQKQAIIHRAVTRGLDPDVPMKDSGIEWLGQVPEHWNVLALGMAASSIQTGPFGSQLHASEYIAGGTPVINPSHMSEGRIKADPSISAGPQKTHDLARHKLNPGDIVAARRGELGRCALVTDKEKGWLCGTGSLRIRPINKLYEPSYLQFVFSSQGVKDTLGLSSIGATMNNLNAGMVAQLKLPCPPLEEQRQLMGLIDEEKNKSETAIQVTKRQIEVISEYRTRLIADVVTGKLDVREAAAKLPDEADEPEPLEELDELTEHDIAMDDELDAMQEGAIA